jgi:hypothetical protein
VVGFIGSFGLLLWPILMALTRTSKVVDPRARKVVDVMALIVALHALDLVPNGLFTQMPFFLAGALAGLSQGIGGPRQRPGPR